MKVKNTHLNVNDSLPTFTNKLRSDDEVDQ